MAEITEISVSEVAILPPRPRSLVSFRRSCCSARYCFRSPAPSACTVHYAMSIILAMGIGLFAPPFGVGYYAASAVGGLSVGAPGWIDHRRGISMDLDWVLVII